MHRISSQVAARLEARGITRRARRIAACAAAAVACLLIAPPGLAADSVGSGAFATGTSLRQAASSDTRMPATGPVMASADLAGFGHRSSVGASPIQAEAGRAGDAEVHVHAADRPRGEAASDGIPASSIVEPVSIAVLGFMAAALIAKTRRKAVVEA